MQLQYLSAPITPKLVVAASNGHLFDLSTILAIPD